jgi:hypothetical protein
MGHGVAVRFVIREPSRKNQLWHFGLNPFHLKKVAFAVLVDYQNVYFHRKRLNFRLYPQAFSRLISEFL